MSGAKTKTVIGDRNADLLEWAAYVRIGLDVKGLLALPLSMTEFPTMDTISRYTTHDRLCALVDQYTLEECVKRWARGTIYRRCKRIIPFVREEDRSVWVRLLGYRMEVEG